MIVRRQKSVGFSLAISFVFDEYLFAAKVNRHVLTDSNNLYNTIINNKTLFFKSTDFLFHVVRIGGWVGGV